MSKLTKTIWFCYLILISPTFMGGAMAEDIIDWGWYHWSQADFNGDFIVDILDLSMLAEDWQTTDYNQTYTNNSNGEGTDINGDGIVNPSDLSEFSIEWLRDVRSTGIGKIKAWVESAYRSADEPDGPYLVVSYDIYNMSTFDEYNYEILVVDFMSGLNDGIHPDGVVIDRSNPHFEPHLWNYIVEPNEVHASTYSGIIPNHSMSFQLWVADEHVDPNDVGIDYIYAISQAQIRDLEIEALIIPIKAPMPKRD